MADRHALMLLDSASLYFRAFYGVPDSVKAPDGSPVNAVRGLLDMIARLVTDHRPDRLVACWDEDWRPAFRVAAIPSYKAHRVVGGAEAAAAASSDGVTVAEEVPDALAPQVPVIAEVLAALGIARAGAPGYEADDVIGTLTAREVARPAGERSPVLVVTGDRDLFQLVDDDAPVRVLYTIRGIKDVEVVDGARLREKYAVASGGAYADMAVLRGDPSDGLPGVAGIGEKTAAAMLAKYRDLPGLLAARDAGDPGLTATQRRRLVEADDYLAVAPGVVRVAADAPVRLAGGADPAAADAFALPRQPVDGAALVDLTERWGLESSVRRVLTALANR
ncbi:5'-3' exonuclease [Cellulomonas pakistanensis]|uniref:5'-3' exonuclease n=1 Tax=Cellulomonas pakistanensis TaxID=992287 RepID=A0A919P9X4_9CELL|nr:5'-3' exonuclease [Cellulomonas pakistanensis]GIG37109.1 5'-3' exonuclease [Cellulomonas pakistanensis]